MGSDDVWKDGVPPSPDGVQPAHLPPAPWQQPQPGVAGDAPIAVGGAYDAIPPQPRTSEKNWMGIVSLVLGILGGIVLSVVFGLLSLRAYKQQKSTNRGVAITGLAFAGLWAILVGVGIVFALALSGTERIQLADAQVGDCFESSLTVTESLEEGYYDFSPCGPDSNGIVYYITAMDQGVAYDDAALGDLLWDACTTEAAFAGVDPDISYDYYVEYYVSSAEEWAAGDRRVVCGLSTEGAIDLKVLTVAEPNVVD